MYIQRKEPKHRAPVIFAVIAFLTTLIIIFGYAIYRQPEQLLAAFALPDLVTRTPTLIGAYSVDSTATRVPTQTRRPTNTPTETLTPTPMATLAPTATPYAVVEHFMIGRPVGPDEAGTSPDHYYLYGTTGHGDYEVHHGGDFENPLGTQIIATANGTIVVAGRDDYPQCGADGNELCGRKPDYYGNVIVERLDQQYDGKNVFVAYGHEEEVDVKPGQHVNEGDPIAKVGQEGIALGPHVHIEIRLGINSYASTRNEALWMRPEPGTGTLAGRLLDPHGNPIRAASISIYADDADQTYVGDTETYQRDAYPAVNPDDVLQENWTFPDLPVGSYIVSAYADGLQFERRVQIEDGKLTFIVLGG